MPERFPEFSGGVLGLGCGVLDFNPEEISQKLAAFARARNIGEIWLDMAESPAARALAELLSSHSVEVSAPFRLSRGGFVLSSAVVTGSFAEAVERAKKETLSGQLTLEFTPVSVIFKNGSAPEPLKRQELFRLLMRSPAVSFSQRLCVNTMSFRQADGSMSLALFDDESTLSKKLELAAELGVGRVFMRYNAAAGLRRREGP